MLLLAFGRITRLALLVSYTILPYRISIICLFIHVVFSLCPVYAVFQHYCYLHYLFPDIVGAVQWFGQTDLF